jgi:hypothetical protein
MRQDILSSGSYLSSNDKRAHFGLGAAIDAGTTEIRWPSGHTEMVRLPAADIIYTITEGKGITGALCNGSPCPIPQPAAPPPASPVPHRVAPPHHAKQSLR